MNKLMKKKNIKNLIMSVMCVGVLTVGVLLPVKANAEYWDTDGVDYYHCDDYGNFETGWYNEGNDWYYFDDYTAAMVTGWYYDGACDDWYYFNDDGTMLSDCWHRDGDDWYYFDYDGIMETNSYYDGYNWYYFNSDGTMIAG